MSIARITEIKSSSATSFDDAIKTGIARASKTLRNLKSAWIESQEIVVDGHGQGDRVSRSHEGHFHSGQLTPHAPSRQAGAFPQLVTPA
jgi:flavin-binding protein dodecin